MPLALAKLQFSSMDMVLRNNREIYRKMSDIVLGSFSLRYRSKCFYASDVVYASIASLESTKKDRSLGSLSLTVDLLTDSTPFMFISDATVFNWIWIEDFGGADLSLLRPCLNVMLIIVLSAIVHNIMLV